MIEKQQSKKIDQLRNKKKKLSEEEIFRDDDDDDMSLLFDKLLFPFLPIFIHTKRKEKLFLMRVLCTVLNRECLNKKRKKSWTTLLMSH